MGRRPNPQRKQDLLDEIVAYLGEHGIGDLSLRPLAKRLGTSTYTLTYQFGSKGQLLADAVRHALALEVEGVNELAARATRGLPSDLVRRMWEWSTRRENLQLVRMLLEATTLAYSQPEVFGGVGQQIVAEGIGLLRTKRVEHALDEAVAQRLATQAYATLVGLQVDLIATGDRDRVGRALDELCRSLDEAATAAAPAGPVPADPPLAGPPAAPADGPVGALAAGDGSIEAGGEAHPAAGAPPDAVAGDERGVRPSTVGS
jgi:AcrR family transcriptional regulator